MAKKGTKVKELAIELDVTAREIIDRCRAEGLFVQNSITRIAPADVARVRAWFAEHQGPDDDQRAPTGRTNEVPPK